MHIISKKKIKEFWDKHPESKSALEAWFKIVRVANYKSLNELKATFPKADKVGERIVFDIGGNKYRLITVIHFNRGKVYVRDVLTHADYDKEQWKHGSHH